MVGFCDTWALTAIRGLFGLVIHIISSQMDFVNGLIKVDGTLATSWAFTWLDSLANLSPPHACTVKCQSDKKSCVADPT